MINKIMTADEAVAGVKDGMTIKPITPEESAAKLQHAAQQASAMGAAKK